MRVRTALTPMIAILVAVLSAGTAQARTFKVSTVPGLRKALRAAATNRKADTIVLAAGVYRTRGTPFVYAPATGTWTVGTSYDLTIVGAGAGRSILDGGLLSRVLEIQPRSITLEVEVRSVGVRRGSAGGAQGGGLLMPGSANAGLTLAECVFSENAAAAGGAVYATGSLRVQRSSFLANRADATGGAVHHEAGNVVGSILKSVFDGNAAVDGGGVFLSGHVDLIGNTFTGNVASARGGGASLNGYTVVRGNKFLANRADEGGGLWADWYGQTIESDVFAGNSARRGGAAAITYSQYLVLGSNTVTGNSAGAEGGGLAITPQRSSILHTDTFSSNILWGNAAPGSGADLLLDDLIVGNNPRTIRLTANLVGSHLSRCAAADPSAGCIPKLSVERGLSGPPGFVQQSGADPLAWDLRLAAGSPCIDTGLVPSFSAAPSDIEGIQRPLDGDGDGTALPDVGAAERYLGPVIIAPNGTGNPIASGSVFRVEWAAPPDADWFELFFSLDGGSSWRPATGARVAGRSFLWNVPRPTGNLKTCRVKVVGHRADGSAAGEDASNYDFSIEVVRLSLGRDTCTAGQPCSITWKTNKTARPVAQARLQYRFAGESAERDIALVPGNPGSWDWTTPPPAQCAGSFAFVTLTLLDGKGASLGSDAREIQLRR